MTDPGVPLKPTGSLAEHDVPELVQALHERRWNGTFTITHMGVGRSVRVQEGRLVFASSTNPDERLGELLLRRGRISLRQYVEASKAIAPGKRLGTILVEQGVLDAKDLIKSVVEHTQEIIYGTFQLTEGHYRLQEGFESSEAITLHISTPDIILEGIRRIEAWSRIARGVGGLRARYARAPGYEAEVRHMSLPSEKLALLTGLTETRDVDAICAGSSLSSFEVCRTLWAFRVIGLVRRQDEPPAPKPPREEDEGLESVLQGG